MRLHASMRTPLLGAGIFGAGIALATALVARPAPPHAEMSSGTPLGFVPDDVLSFTYVTPWGMTTAQRSLQTAAFEMLSTFADGRKAQRCAASADMAGRLAELSVLAVKRTLALKQREREFPALLGVIEIRNAAISEPAGPVVAYANWDRSAVAVVVDGRAAEVTLPAAELRWLETACAASVAAVQQQDGGDDAKRQFAYHQSGRVEPGPVAGDRQTQVDMPPRDHRSAVQGNGDRAGRAGRSPAYAAVGRSAVARKTGARRLPQVSRRAPSKSYASGSRGTAQAVAAASTPARAPIGNVVETIY